MPYRELIYIVLNVNGKVPVCVFKKLYCGAGAASRYSSGTDPLTYEPESRFKMTPAASTEKHSIVTTSRLFSVNIVYPDPDPGLLK
jgi:hypothetical protein